METKMFSIGAILNITTSRLLTTMDDIYKILNFMTNDNLMTHQLPRASRECKPWLFRQYPQLKKFSASYVHDKETAKKALREGCELFGEEMAIDQIPRDDHDYKNPIEEAIEMVGKDKVVICEIPENDSLNER